MYYASHLKQKKNLKTYKTYTNQLYIRIFKNNLKYYIILCADFNTEPNSITIEYINQQIYLLLFIIKMK